MEDGKPARGIGAWFCRRIKPKHPYIAAAVAFSVTAATFAATVWPSAERSADFVKWHETFRSSLFTGFFTVASFLLSAKTLVILNMHKEVYGTKAFWDSTHEAEWSETAMPDKVAGKSREDCVGEKRLYLPLVRIGSLLTVNILAALAASFSQLTFGAVGEAWASAMCVSLVASAAVLLAYSAVLIWVNFRVIYAIWERNAKSELEERWGKSQEKLRQNRVLPETESLPVPKMVGADEPLPPDEPAPKKGRKKK